MAKKKVDRRQFLTDTGKMVGGISVAGATIGLFGKQAASMPAYALRPPGALPEPEFLGSCIRCGLCVKDCPYEILRLAELQEEVALGTPYFIARDKPCEMCEEIYCIQNCPTGALDPALADINTSRMGVAVLVDQETCLNLLGLRCDICYRVCPVLDEAISLERFHNARTSRHTIFVPTVHSDACTGCGKCEYACPLPVAAIKVLPENIAKGQLGEHYRLGWREKEKAGGALVTPDIEHQYNLPEGYQYDLEGEGLIAPEEGPNLLDLNIPGIKTPTEKNKNQKQSIHINYKIKRKQK